MRTEWISSSWAGQPVLAPFNVSSPQCGSMGAPRRGTHSGPGSAARGVPGFTRRGHNSPTRSPTKRRLSFAPSASSATLKFDPSGSKRAAGPSSEGLGVAAIPMASSEAQSGALVVFKRQPRFIYEAGSNDPDPYAVLQVSRNASLKEVKKAYKQLAYRYHPDRVTAESAAQLGGRDPSVVFAQINAAYTVLVDEYKRTRFHAMESMNEMDIERLSSIKRRNAELEVALMKEAIASTIRMERSRHGVVIVRALYGEMPQSIDMSQTLAEQAFGEVIDVTRPVQYLVEDSRVIVPGGNSKVLLKGFYDPVNGYPKVLAIRYLFRNHLHQAVIRDFDPIRMPKRGHLMPPESQQLVLADIEAPVRKRQRRSRRSSIFGFDLGREAAAAHAPPSAEEQSETAKWGSQGSALSKEETVLEARVRNGSTGHGYVAEWEKRCMTHGPIHNRQAQALGSGLPACRGFGAGQGKARHHPQRRHVHA